MHSKCGTSTKIRSPGWNILSQHCTAAQTPYFSHFITPDVNFAYLLRHVQFTMACCLKKSCISRNIFWGKKCAGKREKPPQIHPLTIFIYFCNYNKQEALLSCRYSNRSLFTFLQNTKCFLQLHVVCTLVCVCVCTVFVYCSVQAFHYKNSNVWKCILMSTWRRWCMKWIQVRFVIERLSSLLLLISEPTIKQTNWRRRQKSHKSLTGR